MDEPFDWQVGPNEMVQGLENLSFSAHNDCVNNGEDGSWSGHKSVGEEENVSDGYEEEDDCHDEEEDDNGEEDEDTGDDEENRCGACGGGCEHDEVKIAINSEADIVKMDLVNFSPHLIVKYDFSSMDMTYKLYVRYAKANGFSVRKGRILRSKKTGEDLQRDYWCSNNGLREDKGLAKEDRKRDIRPETRCNCKANFRVHVDKMTGRWYATVFNDEHNHDLLDLRYSKLLPGNRKMSESDIIQMNSMLKAGIGPSHIYGHFALQCGGYDKIGFRKKDIYNQIERQRKKQASDAMAALKYLSELRVKDEMMYFEHTVDGEGRLQHLFWSDGKSQKSYQLFGDVMAFDATYGKNKYLLPLVVFSGVNNHNRSTIFAAAIVANELEETYVWLLRQLCNVMKGKEPTAVITDGDKAMRNAIKIVFPNARHRLCAWHLQRNAIANVKCPDFAADFVVCMLGDFDVGHFRKKWNDMVCKYSLENNPWVKKMYDCRTKWATAYFRGNFFAGFRTTSRCESLYSELGKHVHSRYNMTDFLQHYHRCVSHMRFREIEDEFSCLHGQPVLQSSFPSLEKSASKYYTKRIFSLFCIVLDKVSGMTVIGCTEVLMYLIYTVRKITSGKEWRVSYYPSTCNLKCSCLMMESRGLPCEHILAVLVHLNIEELPSSLVLKRWTKFASEGFRSHTGDSINYLDPSFLGRWAVLVDMYVGMSELQADTNENFDETREKVWQEFEELKARKVAQLGTSSSSMQGNDEIVRDPVRASTKGRGPPLNSSRGLRVKRKTRCSYCKLTGHNKTTCSQRMRDTQPTDTTCEGSVQFGAEIPFTPSMQNDDASFNVH